MGLKVKDSEFLTWIYERMQYVHAENSNYDYMRRLWEIIERIQNREQAEAILCEDIIEAAGLSYACELEAGHSDDHTFFLDKDKGYTIRWASRPKAPRIGTEKTFGPV